jgi:hypothetical protein
MTMKPIPTMSTAAAPKAKKITVFELEPDVVSVEVPPVVEVDAVLVGVVCSLAFPTSSLNELPPPEAVAAGAGAAGTRANPSAAHSARSAMRELRDATARVGIQRGYRHVRGDTPAGEAPVIGSAAPTRRRARADQLVEWRAMPPKQRQIRIEQRGAFEAIQALEQRSDEELEAETKYKSAAQAILGARAAERFDSERARAYFQRAIAAARPQERMQIRRMADASLALAERRPGDLRDAVERLGQAPPSRRQMFALRAMGLLVPPASAGILARLRGIVLILVLIIVLLAIGTGLVELISLPFGGLGLAPAVLLGLFAVIVVLGVVAAIGRRRRERAKAS